MKVTHSGTTYDCALAIKCENDCYIKLYDENGAEIASFHGIADFSEYTISGGSFADPCECEMPVKLSTYSIGGRTISPAAWTLAESGMYYHEIAHPLISENEATCDILLKFAKGTSFNYDAAQASGKLILYVSEIPAADIVIDSIRITRV